MLSLPPQLAKLLAAKSWECITTEGITLHIPSVFGSFPKQLLLTSTRNGLPS